MRIVNRKTDAKRSLVEVCFWTLEAFTVISFVYFIFRGDKSDLVLCAVTILLLIFPQIIERLLKIKLSTTAHLLALLLSTGPLLGNAYNLYFILTWWDTLLHFVSGILFAMLGFSLPDLIDRQSRQHSKLLKYLTAILFALSTAVVWEFLEYSVDQIFHTDKQQDHIVKNITSYLLGNELGNTGTINDIQSVVINGIDISLGGYLDIGLHDTMMDMFACATGAILFCIIQQIYKSRYIKAR